MLRKLGDELTCCWIDWRQNWIAVELIGGKIELLLIWFAAILNWIDVLLLNWIDADADLKCFWIDLLQILISLSAALNSCWFDLLSYLFYSKCAWRWIDLMLNWLAAKLNWFELLLNWLAADNLNCFWIELLLILISLSSALHSYWIDLLSYLFNSKFAWRWIDLLLNYIKFW